MQCWLNIFSLYSSFTCRVWSRRQNGKRCKKRVRLRRLKETMRGFINSLTLQALLVLWIICSANGAPYSSESNVSIIAFDSELWLGFKWLSFNVLLTPRHCSHDGSHFFVNSMDKHNSFYSSIEYGRTCKDIGCLPREVCVMAYESCSFSQQENVSCGRYPTCKKNTEGQATQQNAGNLSWSPLIGGDFLTKQGNRKL